MHTKSKLIVDPEGDHYLLIDEEGRTIFIAAVPLAPEVKIAPGQTLLPSRSGPSLTEERIANAERLVACWNYCRDMSTATLQETMREREPVPVELLPTDDPLIAANVQDDTTSAYELIEPAPHKILVFA